MNRMGLSCLALLVVPWLSGCCCCGPSMSCGGYGHNSSSCGGYNDCLSYDDAYSTGNYGPMTASRGKCNCQGGGDDFSLPPEPTNYSVQPGTPYDTYYGPEVVGPEIVGPSYVPGSTEWHEVAPSTPVTPAAPPVPNIQAAPTPIPAISNGSSVVVPAPMPPTTPTSSSVPADGPMMPTVPPPPPEPVSQMRFRQYR